MNTQPTSFPLTTCQVCKTGNLNSVLFLGYIPPVNSMEEIGAISTEQSSFPLELMRCDNCGHVQIGLEVSQEILFPYSYPYLSGTTRILRDNFRELCAESQSLFELKKNDLIVDVGSNDGTLLKPFLESGFRVLGIEPSRAGEVARSYGIDTKTAYFNTETAQSVKNQYGTARMVTAANVFAHITEPHNVVEAINQLLEPEGIFVNESHYLLSLLETLQYDTIYHEHLRYYHLGSVIRLLSEHGLEVFHVKQIPTHGGSIRIYAGRTGQHAVRDSVSEQLKLEENAGLNDGSAFSTFRERVLQSKVDLHSLVAPFLREGHKIYGVGAPSRASTLINYIGIDDGMMECILEVSNSHKIGKYIPGTRIPVVDEVKLYEDQPEYALLLSWHIADELIPILRKNGFTGKFIVPLPAPMIVEN